MNTDLNVEVMIKITFIGIFVLPSTHIVHQVKVHCITVIVLHVPFYMQVNYNVRQYSFEVTVVGTVRKLERIPCGS